MTSENNSTERLRPVEFGDRDPRHVLKRLDVVLQQQYATPSWRVDPIAPIVACS